ncbi:hypothetical protein Pr1d_11070 [Bythopirellula goksoeyrii]|uniref:Uncharacterized protein n=1 Tax=Bythopirellula goksoeyrii TaxID=1400387 RepID=A0A5B9Q4D9_9BACT|nr:hypothetical protein Pr1d_11070 [Bythopirellula goksoeyrii]
MAAQRSASTKPEGREFTAISKSYNGVLQFLQFYKTSEPMLSHATDRHYYGGFREYRVEATSCLERDRLLASPLH